MGQDQFTFCSRYDRYIRYESWHERGWSSNNGGIYMDLYGFIWIYKITRWDLYKFIITILGSLVWVGWPARHYGEFWPWHIWVFPSMANHPPKRTILWGKSMVGTPILEYPCIIMYIYNFIHIYIYLLRYTRYIPSSSIIPMLVYYIHTPLYCMVYPHWDNTNAKSLLPSSKVLTVSIVWWAQSHHSKPLYIIDHPFYMGFSWIYHNSSLV